LTDRSDITSPSQPTPARRVTARDVAARAGVSQSAVSLVLNGRGDQMRISLETQERIQAAAVELGYQCDVLARALRGESTRSVGLMFSVSGSPSGSYLIGELARRFGDQGFAAYASDHRGMGRTAARELEALASRRVDAVVVQASAAMMEMPIFVNALKMLPHVVLIAEAAAEGWRGDVIIHERLAAHRAMVDHLVARGCRRPAVLTVRNANAVKVDVVMDHFQSLGLPADGVGVIELGEFVAGRDSHVAYEVLESQFGQAGGRTAWPFDGLICMNDRVAVGAVAWLRKQGLVVPRDVAVIGVNDSSIAPYQYPPLASVFRNDDVLCDQVMAMFERRVAEPDVIPRTVEVAMRFVPRESADLGDEPPPLYG